MIEKNFGWWPRDSLVDARFTRAEPLPTHADSVAAVRNDPRAYGDFYYPPLVEVGQVTGETKAPPQVPAVIYPLPVTHRISATESWMDEEYLNFAIVLMGLVDGMRLIPEGWVHFYKAPIARGKLCDLSCDAREIAEVIYEAANWWQQSIREVRRAMFGAIHWFCFSGLYQHEFEEFAAKYIVLDTLDWIHRKLTGERPGAHATRAFKLAKVYKLQVPTWAVVQKKTCRLAEIRNALIHEGQFGGEPIGLGNLPETSLTLEFGHFLIRLIIAILGVKCLYIKSPTNTRCRHGIDLLQRNLT
jgi:hypothetical protein